MKNVKLAANIALYAFAFLGMAAKIKKDITTHRQHENHDPCTCDSQCLNCLVTI